MTVRTSLIAALAHLLVVAIGGVAWLALPALAPDLVLAQVRLADPVAGADLQAW